MFGAALLGACGPDSTTDSLTVVATVPTEGSRHAADAPLRVRFDGYLSESMRLGAAASLASAEVGVAISVLYDPVEQGLVIVPARPLRVGLGYTLTVDASVVEGVSSAPSEPSAQAARVTSRRPTSRSARRQGAPCG